jgi:DNA-directed RNA polymerase specialized sigma24 family protein
VLGALPAHYRTAVVLHDVEGLSNLEVAEFLRKRLAAYMATSGLAGLVAKAA